MFVNFSQEHSLKSKLSQKAFKRAFKDISGRDGNYCAILAITTDILKLISSNVHISDSSLQPVEICKKKEEGSGIKENVKKKLWKESFQRRAICEDTTMHLVTCFCCQHSISIKVKILISSHNEQKFNLYVHVHVF